MPFVSRSSKPKPPLDEAGLLDYAVKALGRRMRSEAEIRRLMAGRVEHDPEGEALIARVLVRLKEYGYLNDTVFAETYTRLRQENEKFGQRRVRQDLQQKGVKPALIEETLTARYGQMDEAALARQHLERKRLKKPTSEKETARILRRLVGAGFSTTAIYKVLREWDVPEETLEGIESVDVGESGEEL
jgi:regulatory protein